MTSLRFALACGIVLLTLSVTKAEWPVSIKANLSDPEATQKSARLIEQALRSATTCKFADTPLEEALKSMEDRHQIDIWLDKQALQDEGITTDQQVSLMVRETSLESALNLMLEPMGLTYVIEDGVLKITTQAKADERMSVRVYPVGDLVTNDYRALVETIQTSTSGKWVVIDQEGGSISPFRNARSIVVRQTQRIHREIEGILEAIRESKKLQQKHSIPTRASDPPELSPFSEPKATPTRSTSKRTRHPQSDSAPRFVSAGG